MKKLAPVFVLAVACGGNGGGKPVGDKGQAADATYNLIKEKQSLESRTASSLRAEQVPGVNVDSEVTVQGERGSAKITVSTQIDDSVRVKYRVVFDGYSTDGINVYDGDLTYFTEVKSSASGASVVEEVKGSATVTGEYAATLDIDVRMEISAAVNDVSIKITGFIEADGSRFSYDGELIGIHGDGRIDVPNEPNNPDPTRCRGNYVGTYSGTASGNVLGTLEGNTFTVTFTSDLGDRQLTYNVAADGAISGTSSDIEVDAGLFFATCTISGLWESSIGTAGTWEASLR